MRIKKRTKYILSILFLILVGCGFMSQNALAVEISDIFIDYKTYNSSVEYNYGVLQTNGTENNNYRNYLDTSIEVNEFYEYNDMVNFNNSVDYSNYLISQEQYQFDYDTSFNSTNGNYIATYDFDSEYDFYANFDYTKAYSTYISIENYVDNHLSVLKINDNNDTSEIAIINEFSENREYGSIDFWLYINDMSQEYYLGLNDDSIESLQLKIFENSIFYWNDTHYVNISYLNEQDWYHFSLDFECSDNAYFGLNEYQFQLRINTIQYGVFDFYDNQASLNTLNISTSRENNSLDYYYYLDSLGYTWNQDIYENLNYTATYSFDNEVGLENDDISFIDDYNTYLTWLTYEVLESYEYHPSVLEIDDSHSSHSAYIIHNMNYSSQGVIEFYLLMTNNYAQMKFYNEHSNIIGTINFHNYIQDDFWYHIKIEYDCSNEHYEMYVNDILEIDNYFGVNSTCISSIRFGLIDDYVQGKMYLDAIGILSYFNHTYQGIYSFDNEIGNDVNDIDFIDAYNIETGCSISVNESYYNHSSVLEIDSSPSSSRAYLIHYLDNQVNNVNFSIEFWTLQTNSMNRIAFFDSNLLRAKYLQLNSYSDNNVWNHFRFDIDCINGNYSMYVNEILTLDSLGLENYVGSIDSIWIGSLYTDISSIMYYDAFGFTYYSNTGYWNSTYSFKNEVGLTGTDIDYVDSDINEVSEVISGYKGHKDVLYINADSSHSVRHSVIENCIDFTIDFWFLYDDCSGLYLETRSLDYKMISYLRFYPTYVLLYYDGGYEQYFIDMLDNWIHFSLRLDYSNSSQILWINDVYQGSVNFVNEPNDSVQYIGYYKSSAGSYFTDAIGLYYNRTGNYNASFNMDSTTGIDITHIYDDAKYQILDYYDEHLSVFNVSDYDNINYFGMNFDVQDINDGIIEFWINQKNYGNNYIYFQFYDSDNHVPFYLKIAGSNLNFYDDLGATGMLSISLDTWYHIRITFDCSLETAYIYVNENLEYISTNWYYESTLFDIFRIQTNSAHDNIETYIDSIGFSWLDNYTIGQNLNDYYQDNTYEIGSNYDEYLQTYSNTYELGSNQVVYFTFMTDYVIGNNKILTDYNTITYVLNDNLFSEFNIDNEYIAYLYQKQLQHLGSSYDYGLCFYNGYWITQVQGVIKRYDVNFKYVDSITLITGTESYHLNKLMVYQGLLYVYLRNYDKIRIYNETFDYQTTINLQYAYEPYCIEIYKGLIYGITYSSKIALVYYLNGTLKENFGSIGITFLDMNIYDDKIYGIDVLTSSYYVFDSNFTFIESISFEIALTYVKSFDIIDGLFYNLYSKTYENRKIISGILSKDFVQKGMLREYLLYNDDSELTGKLTIETNKLYSYQESYQLSYDMRLYYYSNSFIEIGSFRNSGLINLNDTFLELQVQVQVGNRDFFKKLLVNFTYYMNDMNQSIVLTYDYNVNYNFDKILMSFSYSQKNIGIYYDKLTGINSNYFKNDFYAYRIFGCLDLEQVFTKFYNFGKFDDIIDLSELDLPEIPQIPSQVDLLPYWLYQVSNITYDSNVLITTTNFNYSYPYVVVDISAEKFPYNPETIAYIQTPQITGNWGIFDFLREGLNFIIYVLVSIPNIFILLVNFGITAGYFIAYLIIAFFNTIIMTYIVGGIMILFINVIGYWIIYGFTWFIDGIYIFITNIQRIILAGVGLIGMFIAFVLWAFTGFRADYNAILTAVNSILFYVADFVLEIITIMLENLTTILFYAFAYVLCVELILLKYYYTKARGFKARSERIYESYLSYYLIIGYVIRFFVWIKNMLTGWI